LASALEGSIHLPARDIPIPSSVSEEAQQVLAMGSLAPPLEWPALEDAEAWRQLVRVQDETVASILEGALGLADVPVVEREIDRVNVFIATGERADARDRRVYLDVHGGAWAFQGGAVCRLLAAVVARSLNIPVWSVDYRRPPDHPWPDPVADCLTIYRSLLENHHPGEIVVGGTSAGGNIAASMILMARDEGLPLPAATVLNTPSTDLTAAGDTWKTNAGLDNLLTGTEHVPMLLYAGGHDLRDPLISPLFGDFSKGFPPTILTTGTRDLLLSDTVRFHRALRSSGIEAELHVWEAGGHGLFLGMAPEDAERAAEIATFLDKHWNA
jgi:epsilon-lactone hydrolase